MKKRNSNDLEKNEVFLPCITDTKSVKDHLTRVFTTALFNEFSNLLVAKEALSTNKIVNRLMIFCRNQKCFDKSVYQVIIEQLEIIQMSYRLNIRKQVCSIFLDLESILTELLSTSNLGEITLTIRFKALFKQLNKILRNKNLARKHKILDNFGIAIEVDTTEMSHIREIEKLVKQLVCKNYGFSLITKKDYYQKPKKTGYKSLHLLFMEPTNKFALEIQIMTYESKKFTDTYLNHEDYDKSINHTPFIGKLNQIPFEEFNVKNFSAKKTFDGFAETLQIIDLARLTTSIPISEKIENPSSTAGGNLSKSVFIRNKQIPGKLSTALNNYLLYPSRTFKQINKNNS